MRLIDADAFLANVKHAVYTDDLSTTIAVGICEAHIMEMPTIDAAPVKHGRWEPSEKYFGYNKCSVCADCYIDPEWAMNGKWHYCPNCGAKMDLEG